LILTARYRCLWELGRLSDIPAGWTGNWPGAMAVRRPDDTGESLADILRRLDAAGDQLSHLGFSVATAGILRRRGSPEWARSLLLDVLARAVEAGARPLEYLLRTELAIVDPSRGWPELERARELMTDDRSWTPMISALDHAEAVVRGFQGDQSAAEAGFGRALESYRTFNRPWAELSILLDRSAGRAAAGDGEGSAADRTRAVVLVRSLGGAAAWAG
jgi:hypothetical protein